MADSGRLAPTSLTRLAPACKAARATAGFIVSMEIGTLLLPASRSTTGRTRRSSSASGTGTAWGRVDSPPTSMISAPSSINCSAWATAAAGSRHRPPSENESGVTFTMPIRRVGRGKVQVKSRARRIMQAKAGCRLRRGRADHSLDALDQPPCDLRHQVVRHAQAGIRRLAEQMALVVDVVDDHPFTLFALGDFAGEEGHAGEGGDPADQIFHVLETELGPLRSGG